jgi:hypothetical protein
MSQWSDDKKEATKRRDMCISAFRQALDTLPTDAKDRFRLVGYYLDVEPLIKKIVGLGQGRDEITREILIAAIIRALDRLA